MYQAQDFVLSMHSTNVPSLPFLLVLFCAFPASFVFTSRAPFRSLSMPITSLALYNP